MSQLERSPRRWLFLASVAVVLGIGGWAYLAPGSSQLAAKQTIVVYKSPTCGCCEDWVAHLRREGFEVVTHDQIDMNAIKTKFGVPGELASCHTATVANYVVEGHVPGDVIVRMLKERPPITGLAVPGMPGGSPGMESAPKVPYSVIAFDAAGTQSLYESR